MVGSKLVEMLVSSKGVTAVVENRQTRKERAFGVYGIWSTGVLVLAGTGYPFSQGVHRQATAHCSLLYSVVFIAKIEQ
jgi:hypothetical protein